MPADIVNLRRVRKAKSRAEHDRQADANRVAYGRTKTEKTATKSERERSAKTLEDHRRDNKDR